MPRSTLEVTYEPKLLGSCSTTAPKELSQLTPQIKALIVLVLAILQLTGYSWRHCQGETS
jgi:hypothetical protein